MLAGGDGSTSSESASSSSAAPKGNRAARLIVPKELGGDRVVAFAVTERSRQVGVDASEAATKKAEKELSSFAPIIQRTVGDIAQYTGRISGNRKAADAAGGCPLFAGKQVAGKGWCSAWAKKA